MLLWQVQLYEWAGQVGNYYEDVVRNITTVLALPEEFGIGANSPWTTSRAQGPGEPLGHSQVVAHTDVHRDALQTSIGV